MVSKKIYIGKNPPSEWAHIFPEGSLKIKQKKCSVSEVISDRVVDNLTEKEVILGIKEWRRILSVGGRFIIIFSDIVKAVFLYKRGVISHSKLVEILNSQKSASCLERIENLLLIRYSNVYEIHGSPFIKNKKIWETILVAEKEKLN